MGGIGKSEIARAFAIQADKTDIYHTVYFTIYGGSLVSTIANMPFINDTLKVSADNIYECFEEKIKRLRHCDKETLIIIDNFNPDFAIRDGESDESRKYKEREQKILEELHSMDANIIFTTRNYYNNPKNLIPQEILVPSLSVDELKLLFFNNCAQAKPYENFVEEIIELAYKHTLTVVLVARLMSVVDGLTANKFNDLIKVLKISYSKNYDIVKNYKDYILTENPVYCHIKNLFDYSAISKEGKGILTNLCLVPPTGIITEDFNDIVPNPFNRLSENQLFVKKVDRMKIISELIKSGWITESDNFIYLHPIIADMIFTELNPHLSTFSNCGYFGWSLTQNLQDSKMLWEDKKVFVNIGQNIYEKFMQKDRLSNSDFKCAAFIGGICTNFGFKPDQVLFSKKMNQRVGFSKLKKAVKNVDKSPEDIDKNIRDKFYSEDYLAELYKKNQHSKAVGYINNILPNQENKIPFGIKTAALYNTLGANYCLLNNYSKAIVYGNIAIYLLFYKYEAENKYNALQNIRQFVGEEAHTEYGTDRINLYNSIKSNAYTMAALGYHRETQICLEWILNEVSELILSNDNAQISDIQYMLIKQYVFFKDYEKAFSLLEEMKISSKTRRVERTTGQIYLDRGDIERAKNCFQNALESRLNDDDSVGKENKLDLCDTYYYLSKAYLKNNEAEKALEYAKKRYDILLLPEIEIGEVIFAGTSMIMGEAYMKIGQYQNAEQNILQALELLQKVYLPEPPQGLTKDAAFTHDSFMLYLEMISYDNTTSETYPVKLDVQKIYADLENYGMTLSNDIYYKRFTKLTGKVRDSDRRLWNRQVDLWLLCYRPHHEDILEAYDLLLELYQKTGNSDKLNKIKNLRSDTLKSGEFLDKKINERKTTSNLWWQFLQNNDLQNLKKKTIGETPKKK